MLDSEQREGRGCVLLLYPFCLVLTGAPGAFARLHGMRLPFGGH